MPDRTTIAGVDGYAFVGEFGAHVHSWSMDIECDTPEDTNWTDWQDWPAYDGWRSYLPGLRGWSGSFECYGDEEPTSNLLPGLQHWGLFYVNYNPDGGVYVGYSGLVIVNGVHPSVTIDGMYELSADFQGTGPITIGDIGEATTTSPAP